MKKLHSLLLFVSPYNHVDGARSRSPLTQRRKATLSLISGSRCSDRAAPSSRFDRAIATISRAVKSVTDFKYVRFHAILHDEVGVYNEDEHGNPVYNFAYVDQIYDGLLQNGVKPLVEISFMPKKLAFNPDALHPFWYKPNVSPTKSYEKWDDLIRHFAQHLVDRYGIEEVSTWYFEVWNEPNIDFWGGIPRERSYFELYDHTATALKSVNSRIRVGGPATAAAAWVDDFLKHAAEKNIPVDFVSTHGYADDTVEDLFHTNESIEMDDRVCRAVAKVRGQIKASAKAAATAALDRVECARHDGGPRYSLRRTCARQHSS